MFFSVFAQSSPPDEISLPRCSIEVPRRPPHPGAVAHGTFPAAAFLLSAQRELLCSIPWPWNQNSARQLRCPEIAVSPSDLPLHRSSYYRAAIEAVNPSFPVSQIFFANKLLNPRLRWTSGLPTHHCCEFHRAPAIQVSAEAMAYEYAASALLI